MTLQQYQVLTEPKNGGRIAGRRRSAGDIFDAEPHTVAFLLAEGLIKPAPSPGEKPAAAQGRAAQPAGEK